MTVLLKHLAGETSEFKLLFGTQGGGARRNGATFNLSFSSINVE